MKLTFLQSNKQNWGNLQKDVANALIQFLGCGKDFEIEFNEVVKSKSARSLRGYWRLCGLLVPYFQKTHGEIFDKEMVSDLVKLHCNYSVKRKQVILPRSLRTINQEQMNILIEKIYEMCEAFGLKSYELLPDELRDQNNYFEK